MTKFYIIIVFIVGLIMMIINKAVMAQTTGHTYYISPAGNDANAGTQTSPFKTFAKAVNVLTPGDQLILLRGTYNQKLLVNKSGTQTNPINIIGEAGQLPIIDLNSTSNNNLDLQGSYLDVSNIKTINSSQYCVSLTGNYITIENLIVSNCQGMGIYTDGKYNVIRNNIVTLASMVNQARTASSWGSGIKVRVGGENILIEGNTLYHNYGEGLAVTRGKNITVRHNQAYDNFGVNFYIDNSVNVLIEKNFSYCHQNSGFERDGRRAHSFVLGEEYYDGWGAQLSDIRIENNVSLNCDKGVVSYNANVDNGGLKNVTIAHNTLWGNQNTALSIAYDAYKTQNTVIANNIIEQRDGKLAWIENRTGIIMSNNFWVPSLPASSSQANGTNDKSGDVKLTGLPTDDPLSLRLASNSPAINSSFLISNITQDYSNNNRDSLPDIGAFEYSASSPTPSPTPTPICQGDYTNDNLINASDLLYVLSHWGASFGTTHLLLVLSHWGAC